MLSVGSYCYFIHFFKMVPHKLQQTIEEQSKENEFLFKMIGIPCKVRSLVVIRRIIPKPEYNNFLLEQSDANIFEDSGLPRKEPPVVFTVVTTSCYYFYCTRSTGVFILLIIFLASLNRDLSQESRCEVVITTKS